MDHTSVVVALARELRGSFDDDSQNLFGRKKAALIMTWLKQRVGVTVELPCRVQRLKH